MNSHFLEQQARERIGQMTREASSSRLAKQGQSKPEHRRFGFGTGALRLSGSVQTLVKSVRVVANGVWGKQADRTR